jgi:hypothetical protein
MRSDHQVRLNTVMIPVTEAKIMVPMSGTKIAQDSQSPWFTAARIRNSAETPEELIDWDQSPRGQQP